MVNRFPIWRGSRILRASCLPLVVWLATSNGGLSAQERVRGQPAALPVNKLVLTPAPGEISVRTGDTRYDSLVGVEPRLVRYLLEELIDQRLKSGHLNTALAAADARCAEIEKAAREKETALAAWIAGLRDELAQREAPHAYDASEGAFGARLLEEARAAAASARARRQLAALQIELKEQNRQMAIVQSVAEDLARRLDTAEAELQRREAENERLTAELSALRVRTRSARVLAHPNGGPNADPVERLPERPEQPPELPYVTWVDLTPTKLHPYSRLGASEVEGWMLASHTSNIGEAAPGGMEVLIEDAAWTGGGLFSAAENLYVPETMSTAALAPSSSISRLPEPGGGSPTGLAESVARLADGLRATREEAILQQRERVFTVDVDKRAFASSATDSMPLDPALDIGLLTAKSELIGESMGGIRFFPDGSSTGGRIELHLLEDRAAVKVHWSTGAVMLER